MGYLCIGKFLKPYGLKGRIKAVFYIDKVEDLESFSAFYVRDLKVAGGYRKVEIELLSNRDNYFVLKIGGANDRTSVEGLRNIEIYVDESELPVLKGNSYYIKDLIGLKVYYKGEELGEVINFLDVANQFILIMKLLNGKDVAIPFRDKYFPEIILKEGKAIADNLEDFL